MASYRKLLKLIIFAIIMFTNVLNASMAFESCKTMDKCTVSTDKGVINLWPLVNRIKKAGKEQKEVPRFVIKITFSDILNISPLAFIVPECQQSVIVCSVVVLGLKTSRISQSLSFYILGTLVSHGCCRPK